MKTTTELVDRLRSAPKQWMDAAIVVAFDNRFEFVGEDDPDPTSRLDSLQEQGGLAIGLAGVKPTGLDDVTFSAKVFREYEGQAWAHRYMDTLRKIVQSHGPQ